MEEIKELENQRNYIIRLREYAGEFSEKKGRVPRYFIQTFGCQMNERDSEKLSGILREGGFEAAPSEEDSDLVLYNTCTVRDNADKRIFGRLGVLKGYKKNNPGLIICLAGCLMQEKGTVERIRTSYPYVDLVFGTHNIHKFAELLYKRIDTGETVIEIEDSAGEIVEELPSERKYPFKSGVNIMFGCDNFCSYCIVPYVRGRERSRKSDDIIREIEGLVSDGVKEVMLLGQNVNSYGKGLSEDISFPLLLDMVSKIEGLKRIRFMTSHPKDLSDDLIDVMANNENICRHLHLPVQSGSDRILKLMNRHYDIDSYLKILYKLRSKIPDIAITTDIIVGFPGEEKEDILMTEELVKKAVFDGAFTFIYSPRTGTPAAGYKQLLTEEEIQEGFDKVLNAVRDSAKKAIKRFVGRRMSVLIEGVNERDENLLDGRLSQNTMVHFKGGSELVGEIKDVLLTEECGFYYKGEL